MNVEINYERKQVIEYPCLMQGISGVIVLMIRYGVGTCITNAEKHGQEPMGRTYANWDMDSFKIFEGEITLSN